MLKSLDDSIGDMLKTLKETNQLDNTIIMFISDNGGIKRPDKDGKATISNNTPLKGEKALLYEGGIRVPFFVWQPEKFKASSCDRPVDINDIFPTLLELGQYPLDQYKTYGDGQSLVPILSGSESHNYKRDTFHWHYPFYVSVGLKKGDLTAPRSAIRHKDWKLILNWEGKLELYNIENDLEEKHNLVNQEPERTQKLFKQLTSWINKTVEKRYIPIQNSAYKKHLNTAREFHDIFSDYDQTWPQGRSSRVKSKN
jgi:arylsulfatase A-like enzyme